jgi:hypothetical protein
MADVLFFVLQAIVIWQIGHFEGQKLHIPLRHMRLRPPSIRLCALSFEK